MKQKVPTYWGAMIRGILKLKTSYSQEVINLACKRALRFNALGYQQIKKVCESGLYRQDESPENNVSFTEGYGHDLSIYDQITRNN